VHLRQIKMHRITEGKIEVLFWANGAVPLIYEACHNTMLQPRPGAMSRSYATCTGVPHANCSRG